MGRPPKNRELVVEKTVQQENKETKQAGMKRYALESAIKQIKAKHGDGVIYEQDKSALLNKPIYSTGLLTLDEAINPKRFGIPGGHIIEIYGNEHSGKTTLALQMAADVQKKGGVVLYMDFENKLNLDFAEAIGVDTNSKSFIIAKPIYAEEGWRIMEDFIRTSQIDLVVLDSVASMAMEKEVTEGIGTVMMGNTARLNSQACRNINSLLGRPQNNALLVLINQTRTNISGYGNPNTTAGGKAIRFYCVARLEVTAKEKLTDKNGEPSGQNVKVKVVKNQIGSPLKEVDLVLRYGEGFDTIGDVIRKAIDLAIVDAGGAGWYNYEGTKIQGEENFRQWVKDNNKVDEIKSKVLGLMKPQ